MTGRGAWNRLFDETLAGAPLRRRRRDAAARADAEPPGRPATRRGARRRPRRSPRRSRRTSGSSRSITNVLAKDKSISDDWRGFKTSRPRGTSPTASSRRWWRRWSPRCATAYPRLSHRYYALKARWLGKEKLEFWDRNAPLPETIDRKRPLGRGARDRARRLWRLRAGDGGDRRALLRQALDRRADAARQGARRLRASDRALGAPLRAAQLPGQDARRDDARPRARPRRAPGAGRRAGPADVADAADAGRDRERLRRDADLPRHARRAPTTRASARSCSPPRSRT